MAAGPIEALSDLRLETALSLLAQAGWQPPPDAPPGSTTWLQAVIDGLCEVSSRDALTGLSNRRQFEAAIAREVDRVARIGEPALLLLADIDHFKKVNDTHGHAAPHTGRHNIYAMCVVCICNESQAMCVVCICNESQVVDDQDV